MKPVGQHMARQAPPDIVVHHEPSQQTSSNSRNLQARPHNLLHQTLEAGKLPQSAACRMGADLPGQLILVVVRD
jgi:hypothetical protein